MKKQVWNKGLKGTQEANSGSFRKGEHRSPATQFDGSYSGSKHWNWKGGVTSESESIRTSAPYKKWRTAVFERDNYTCTWCDKKNGDGERVYLEADHIKPFASHPQLRFDLDNGRTLCKECHSQTGSFGARYHRFREDQIPKKFVPITDRIAYGGALIGFEEIDAIFKTICSQGGRRWTIGEESVAMEAELAKVTGVKRAVLTNSGSSALLVAMTALHLPKGSKVIIPAVNFPTAFNAILQCGLIPVVVDVDIATLNLSMLQVTKAMHDHPDIKAVIAVDIAGNPVDLPLLREIVGDKVKIILDDCDGYGTLLNGKPIEQYADVSCVSFHAAHIITMGEGGAVLTDDEEIGARAFKLREWGRASGSDKIYEYEGFPDDYKERYVYEEIGFNVKPLELQCAMGRIQLKKLAQFREARENNYHRLQLAFSNNKHFDLIETIDDATPCWFSFPILCRGIKRGKVMAEFEKNNIECRTIFSGNVIKHPAYKDSEFIVVGELTNADDVMENGMFLSCHPSLVPEMIDFIEEVANNL